MLLAPSIAHPNVQFLSKALLLALPLLLDLNLPDFKGLDLFSAIRKLNDAIPIIIITAHGSVDVAIEAIRQGAFDFLVKTDSLLERVFVATNNAFKQLELSSQLAQLSNELGARYKFQQIISVSEPMKRVFATLSHAVDSRVTVLIQGDSGTGKELVAKALHYNGDRNKGPFVPINVAGIPETLLESELFGHEKGAFTGANMRRRGKFEEANRGTLFLDEIGEMPLALQSKLLRALQEREIERLGGNERIKLDVRIVCATNRDLLHEVQQGRFREDLYYRLAVFPIQLPPLRERVEDIPVLAHHFLRKCSKEEGKKLSGFTPEALAALRVYPFPGNVRELENLVSHAVVVAPGPDIRTNDLPPHIGNGGTVRNYSLNSSVNLDKLVATTFTSVDQIPLLEEVESSLIERTVQLCGGNLMKAAKILGMSRATIYRRIAKLGIRRLQ